MKRLIMIAVALSSGCASTTFHEGRTTLGKEEQVRERVRKGDFRAVLAVGQLAALGFGAVAGRAKLGGSGCSA
jgi:hypothetical protein